MDIVIYTQRVEVIEAYAERRDCADQRIGEFIRVCGFLPIPVPNCAAYAAEVVNALKPCGIVLTGGNSLVKYGGNAPERDGMDAELIRIAMEREIPLYGFCRGMQSILDYFGASLEQVSGHVAVRHGISGAIDGDVNSYHNQACVRLADSTGLEVLARSQDGVIEAVRHNEKPIMGTMWHPEREKPFSRDDVDRIKTLFMKGE